MMQQRQAFDIALKELKWKLLRMGGDIQEAIRRAIAALETQDVAMAQAVVNGDRNINAQDHEIEDLCIRLIATQQPVAGDLRRIVAGMRLAMDLERMGDLAVDIAKSVLRMGIAPSAQAWKDIGAMAKMVDAMIAEALNAYVNSDVEAAKRLAQMDDEIDHHYRRLVEQLFNRPDGESTTAPQAMATAFCGRYLERIGDHITNIGESVIYIISGERSDLN